MTLYGTRKLLKRLRAPTGFMPAPPGMMLGDWYANYNVRSSHQAIDYRTPDEVYFGGLAAATPSAARA